MQSKFNEISELADCALCPRECHANRIAGPLGWCRADAGFSISSICIHRGEEPAVSGRDGICNIFFTNCNLQCTYCQNWQISDNRIDHSRNKTGLGEVTGKIIEILGKGIKRVGFVSPSHYIPQMLAIIGEVEKRGYKPFWVYNSNGYDKAETLKRLEGIIDVYLPDLKYLDSTLSASYSKAADYPEVAVKALKEMFRQKGSVLHTDTEGQAESGIIVRHLVLPGEVENSRKVLQFIAGELSPRLHVSLMAQYYPTPAVACHPRLGRTVTPEEYGQVTDELERLGMHNGWVQELGSHGHYRPDFRRDHPFESNL